MSRARNITISLASLREIITLSTYFCPQNDSIFLFTRSLKETGILYQRHVCSLYFRSDRNFTNSENKREPRIVIFFFGCAVSTSGLKLRRRRKRSPQKRRRNKKNSPIHCRYFHPERSAGKMLKSSANKETIEKLHRRFKCQLRKSILSNFFHLL